MNINEFLKQVNEKQCQIHKGKEQFLYTTVQKYGHNHPHVEQALKVSCPRTFIEKMKVLIKIIPVYKKQIDLKKIARDYYQKFIEEKYVRPFDFIEIVNLIKQKKQPSLQEMARKYGMRQEYQKDLNQLIQNIEKIQRELQYDPNQKNRWKQFEDVLLEGSQFDIRTLLSAFLQSQSIENVKQLITLAKKYKIFMKKDKETFLFQVVNNLGMQNKCTDQIINSSTYEAFANELKKLCQKIIQRKSDYDYTKVVGNIMLELRQKWMVPIEYIIKIINNCYFQRQAQTYKEIVSLYGLQFIIQHMKADLIKLTSHIDKQFQVYQINKILQYCKEYLAKITINNNITLSSQTKYISPKTIPKINDSSIILIDNDQFIQDLDYIENIQIKTQPPLQLRKKQKHQLIQREEIEPQQNNMLNCHTKKKLSTNQNQNQICKIVNKIEDFKGKRNLQKSNNTFFKKNNQYLQMLGSNLGQNDKISKNQQIKQLQQQYQVKKRGQKINLKQISQRQNLIQNPFKPINQQSPPCDSIKVLLIIFSQPQVKSLHIIEIKQLGHNHQANIAVRLSKNYSFMGVNFTIAVFDINKSAKHKILIQFSTYNKNIHQNQFKIGQQYYGCNLTIMKDNLFGKNPNNNTIRNYALFQSLNFLIKKIIKPQKNIESQIFIWLKLLYSVYQKYGKNQPNNQEIIQKMLYKIQTKEFSILNTQFFIYFLYAIFKDKAFQYYQRCKLASNMTFPYYTQRYFHKQFPMTQEFNNFYQKLHLFDSLYYDDYSLELTKKLIILNIFCQKEKDIMQILLKVLQYSPLFLAKTDSEIRQLFIKKNSLCAHNYYTIKIKYIKYNFQNRTLFAQQKILLQFIIDLITIYSKKCQHGCNKKVKIVYQDVEDLLTQARGFMGVGRVLRLEGDGSLPLLYSRCKILDKISNHQFDFMQVVNIFVKGKIQSLTTIHAINTFLSAITIPILQLDYELVQKICTKGSGLHTYHIKQIIRSFIEDKTSEYDRDVFEDIISNYFVDNQRVTIQPDILLQDVDQYLLNTEDNTKCQFLKRLFMLLIPKLKVVQQKNNYKRIDQKIFKKYLQVYFKLNNQIFKQIYINKIISQIKQKFSYYQKLVFDELDIAFPYQVQQNQGKRLHLIRIFLQNYQFSVQQIQKKLLIFLKSNDSNYINHHYQFHIIIRKVRNGLELSQWGLVIAFYSLFFIFFQSFQSFSQSIQVLLFVRGRIFDRQV